LLSAGLFLILQCASAVEITEKRVVAEGSSVLLHAPDIKNINFTEWEYIKDTTSEFIVQYYADSQSPTIYSAYKDRVVFYPKNSSLLLQKLQETDSGVYKATIDLMLDKARTTLLEVIKTVPQPKIQGSSGLAGSPIQLFCMTSKGRVDAISWKKDGRPLPPERLHHLYKNGAVLQIEKGERADCGSYSCNVSNAVSWKEAELDVMVVGLPPLLHHAQRMAVVVLVFVVGSTVAFIVLLCQPEKQLGKLVKRWMAVFIQVLVCVSSLLLLATASIWMQQEG
ncbi:CEAM6 protein, partial [Nothocercus julius]|nr:CEAM6 protein [Nothocercus julius]